MRTIAFQCALLLCVSAHAALSPTVTGRIIVHSYATPHPSVTNTVVRLEDARAAFVAVHFYRFELAPGDRVVVRTPNSDFSWSFDRSRNGAFWSPQVPGTVAVVEFFPGVAAERYGFDIDSYIRGFEYGVAVLAPENNPGGVSQVCGIDDRRNPKCFQGYKPMYDNSRATVRLTIAGKGTCTGWLWGSAGHLLTNHHCISTAAEADDTTVTFDAESATCEAKCINWKACAGITLTSRLTLVASSAKLDYALLLLSENPVARHGYLKARRSGPLTGEGIYIPHYPYGFEERISAHSTSNGDAESGLARISVNAVPSCTSPDAGADIGYYADTNHGASGAPVISEQDDLVIALHHCSGCPPTDPTQPNSAVPMDAIINDLGGKVPPDGIAAEHLE
jgi:hypothetical protein